MERKWYILLAFIGGIAIGMNWDKVKKITAPIAKKFGEKSVDCCAGAIKFFAEQKERLEDSRAAAVAQQKLALAPATTDATRRKSR